MKHFDKATYDALIEQLRITGMQCDRAQRNMALLLELLARTGARQEELSLSKVKDIDFGQGQILVRGAKGSRDRAIPLSQDFMTRLKQGLDDSALMADDPLLRLIPTPRTMASEIVKASVKKRLSNELKKHIGRVNIRKGLRARAMGPHALRHTFAINLYRHTKDIMQVKYALGHKSVTSTQIYAEFVEQETMRPEILKAVGE